MHNKKLVAILLVSTAILFTSIAAFAETTDTTTTETTTEVTTTETTTETTITPTAEDEKLAVVIAETYNVTVTAQEVADLHATGLGYGEISKAYGFSSLAGLTVSDVLGLRQTMGWGQVAASLGFKVSDVTRNAQAVQNAANKTKENTKASGQKGQNADHSSGSNSGNGNGGGNGNGNGNGGGNGNGHK